MLFGLTEVFSLFLEHTKMIPNKFQQFSSKFSIVDWLRHSPCVHKALGSNPSWNISRICHYFASRKQVTRMVTGGGVGLGCGPLSENENF
jgi:hypothetical protein